MRSDAGLLTTLAYRLGGRPTFALEGSIFVAGAAVQWLRDKLGLIGTAPETEALARSLPDNGGVYLVPAFVGMGAPYWDPEARGAVVGLTRGSGRAHFARAALEAVAYQSADLTTAMAADLGRTLGSVRVDGGMAANDWLMQFLADVLEVAIERSTVGEADGPRGRLPCGTAGRGGRLCRTDRCALAARPTFRTCARWAEPGGATGWLAPGARPRDRSRGGVIGPTWSARVLG